MYLKMATKKRILITGAAGFLGSHLCDYFLQKQYRVLGIDNLCTGSIKNLEHIKDSHFDFEQKDITKPFRIPGDFDYILNFASPASPVDYLRLPVETLQANSIGAYNCLELARKMRAKILVASTSEVYGDPLENPQTEEYWGNVNPIGPRSVYDEGKRYMEALTMAYYRYHNVDTKIVRIFNTYGPRMGKDDGRAIPNFFTQAIQGKPITIYGTGMQTRSFCYVNDTIEGIDKVLSSDYNFPINIGNAHEISLRVLAEKIIHICDSFSAIIHCPLPEDDPKRRNPDISKAYVILNWLPRIYLDKGLKQTYSYFLNLLR